MEDNVENLSVFDQLNPRIREMLLNKGILDPTDPQQDVIPHIMRGENVLLLSPTGSGKTEAAILPIFHRILSERPQPVSTLFITPLRALNRDLLDRLREYGRELGIRVPPAHRQRSGPAQGASGGAGRRRMSGSPANGPFRPVEPR